MKAIGSQIRQIAKTSICLAGNGVAGVVPVSATERPLTLPN
jgi:hypothetical protein